MNIMMRFPHGKAKVFSMSYDDGTYQDYRLIDIMTKNGLKGSFNINAGWISKTDAVKNDERLSIRQLKELYLPAGQEVALHTLTHPTLTDLPVERISYEYLKDKEILEDIFGTIIRGSAYPNSKYNDKVLASLGACGVAYARGGQQTESFDLPADRLQLMPTARHKNPRLFEIADDFLNLTPMSHHSCALFYLMGHSHEFWRDNNWDLIEKFAEKIGGHNDIWYATSIEICDYIQAFNQIRFNLAATIAENPTSTDVWIRKDGQLFELKSGKTTVL